jgi:glycosyltransferase involved in cell wall biosynthesis
VRIAISLLNFRPGRIGGTETYLRELVAHLPQAAEGDEIVLVADRDVAPHFEQAGISTVVVDCGAQSIICRRLLEATSAYRARKLERAFDKLAPDVVLFPQQVIFPRHISCPAVLVVHDLFHLHLPENLSRLQRWYRRSIYLESVQRADRIIAVSDFTRRCLIEKYALDERSSQIVTVHHGYRPLDPRLVASAAVPGGPEPFLYYPAVSHPHKNHLQLFRTIAQLRLRGMFPYRLILSGQRNSHWRKLKGELRRLELEDIVHHLGFIPFDQVCGLYRDAAAVLFPSSYEGFGIPVLEAAGLGKRLITSQLDVFRELGVPDAFRIDFNDPAALHRALVSNRPAALNRPPQTWQETARQTIEVVRQAGYCGHSLSLPLRRDVESCEQPERISRAA